MTTDTIIMIGMWLATFTVLGIIRQVMVNQRVKAITAILEDEDKIKEMINAELDRLDQEG